MNLSSNTKITRVLKAVSAGTSDQNGSVIDMRDYEGVMFLVAFGALTATQVTKLKAQGGDLADGTDMADLEGSATTALADADGNKLLGLDIYRPRSRYVRVVVDRGTANAVIDGAIAIQYGPQIAPPSHDTTVKAVEVHLSPAEGTA
jgi:hypothetical protein